MWLEGWPDGPPLLLPNLDRLWNLLEVTSGFKQHLATSSTNQFLHETWKDVLEFEGRFCEIY